MRKRNTSWDPWVAGAVIIAMALSPVAAVFKSWRIQSFSAAVTIGSGGSGIPAGALVLTVPQLLPPAAFFGKDVVIPIQMQGPATSNNSGSIIAANPSTTLSASLGGFSGANLSQTTTPTSPGTGSDSILVVSLVYQMQPVGSSSPGPEVTVPIAFQSLPNQPNVLSGTLIIPAQNLQSIRQGGQLLYWFQVVRGDQKTQFKMAGSSGAASFAMGFTSSLSFPVSDLGSVVQVPDPFLTDGNTSVSFAPGALASAGTLLVRNDLISLPKGPGGLDPIVVYDFELQGTRLESEAQLTLSYAAHPDGTLADSNASPENLAPYWLQGSNNWLVMGPRQWDSKMHTISVTTTHFSTYALFLSGATGAADLRPRQRILTPNGDGINDTVNFSGIAASDGVHLFDMKGRRVRHLQSPNLLWDGRDDNGGIVESGLYIYQYISQGDRVSGVILVAK